MIGSSAARPERAVPLWVPGDWNAFFGLFTNVLLNVLVLTGLVLGVIQLPGEVVFGRILPALGIALPLGNLWYAYLAYQMAKREGRSDVAAMPYGPSVPHMFIVVFGVMLPIYLQTKNAIAAWQAGLAWCFIIGVIILIGVFYLLDLAVNRWAKDYANIVNYVLSILMLVILLWLAEVALFGGGLGLISNGGTFPRGYQH
jgi:AGZA family xanthine/uracil permease-like MFS transporter